VLAVEERKGRSIPARLNPGRPDRGRNDLRQVCCGPTRPITALSFRCQSWSIPFPRPFPKSAQRQQIYVRGWLTSVPYTNNIFPVKSFVDSSNNGLDGVCIATAPPSALN
jgi:hypothetical protein